MSQPDSFRRTPTTGLPTPTGPLGAARTAPLDRRTALLDARAELTAVMGSGQALVQRLAPRVKVLARACRRAGVALPGLPPGADEPPASGPAERVLAHLADHLAGRPALARDAAVLVFRLADAEAALAEAATSLTGQGLLVAESLAALKLKLYYLARAPVPLAADPVLAPLFPPAGEAREQATPTDAGSEARAARHALFDRLEAFAQRLAPRIARARAIAEQAGRPPSFKGLFEPARRLEALAIAQLRVSPACRTELTGVIADYDALLTGLAQAREAGDPAPLEAHVAAMSRRLRLAAERPALKDLLAAPPED